MTSEHETPGTPEGTEGTTSASPTVGDGSQFSTPAGMVALGGWILIGVWLVFGVFLTDYFVAWPQLMLAIAAVLLTAGSKELFEKVAPVPVLLKIVGYLLAIMGLVAFIDDVRFFDGTLNEFPDLIGALASYVAYVLAFLGARAIKV